MKSEAEPLFYWGLVGILLVLLCCPLSGLLVSLALFEVSLDGFQLFVADLGSLSVGQCGFGEHSQFDDLHVSVVRNSFSTRGFLKSLLGERGFLGDVDVVGHRFVAVLLVAHQSLVRADQALHVRVVGGDQSVLGSVDQLIAEVDEVTFELELLTAERFENFLDFLIFDERHQILEGDRVNQSHVIDLDGLHVEVASHSLVVPHALGVLVGLELGVGLAELVELVLFGQTIDAVSENVVVAGSAESVSRVELVFVVDHLIDDGLELSHACSLGDGDRAVPRPLRVAQKAGVDLVLEAAIVEAELSSGFGGDCFVPDIHHSELPCWRLFVVYIVNLRKSERNLNPKNQENLNYTQRKRPSERFL